jgi:hypothetical protein
MSDTPREWRRKGWSFLTGDVDWAEYGGTWVKATGEPGEFALVVFENMAEWGDGASGYNAEVRLVNIITVRPSALSEAIRSCWDQAGWEDIPKESRVLAAVEALHGYGSSARLDTITGPSHPERVRAACFRAAEEMIGDRGGIDSKLGEPCNLIGTTWREAMNGDGLAGLRRRADAILAGEEVEDDPGADLLLHCYAAAQGKTIGGQTEDRLVQAGAKIRGTE